LAQARPRGRGGQLQRAWAPGWAAGPRLSRAPRPCRRDPAAAAAPTPECMSLWWKFSLASSGGAHLLRVTNIGTDSQQVFLDGSGLDAPPGTLAFTGPAASFLQLENQGGAWALLVDGVPAESYMPDASQEAAAVPAVGWWKFPIAGMGTHHLRVKNIGTTSQEVWLDGVPVDAPAGTMTFTGPAATFLELQKLDGLWILLVDGVRYLQSNPHADSAAPHITWLFQLPSGTTHQLQASNLGERGQEIVLDDKQIPAPEGTLIFTGPAGALLELRQREGSSETEAPWVLLVDGVAVEADIARGGPIESLWNFVGPNTGAIHHMRVLNIGRSDQKVFIDDAQVDAPGAQTAFTGPGGCLLELKREGIGWTLHVDGLPVEDLNPRSSAVAVAPSAGFGASGREAVATGGMLPQGVSYDDASGLYKANIRIAGKFKCLGDFATPQDAHIRYLEAKREYGV